MALWAYRVELMRWCGWTKRDLEAADLVDVVEAVLAYNSHSKAQAKMQKQQQNNQREGARQWHHKRR